MNYHEDTLDEQEWHYHQCQIAVDQLRADMAQFECADAADEWISDTARRIVGPNYVFSSASKWLRELLEEDGFIPVEVLCVNPIQDAGWVDHSCGEGLRLP